MATPLPTILRDLEQLELAAEQLDRKTPAAARLALILTDNVMEGIAVRIIKHKFAFDAYIGRAMGFKYPPAKRKRIMSEFGSQMNFLASADVAFLSNKAADGFKRCHSFRNESYHHVRYHEHVIEPIARKYFEHVCEVCQRSHGDIMMDMARTEPFLAKHGFIDVMQYADAVKAILTKLPSGRKCPHPDLAKSLADNLRHRIRRTIESVDSLAEEPYGLSPGETLRHVQFYAIDRMERNVEDDDGTAEWFQRREKEWEDELSAYNPPVKYTTLQKWNQSARTLKNESDIDVLLTKYKCIDDSLTPIEDVVTDAGVAYDEYVNNEVDRMCGN